MQSRLRPQIADCWSKGEACGETKQDSLINSTLNVWSIPVKYLHQGITSSKHKTGPGQFLFYFYGTKSTEQSSRLVHQWFIFHMINCFDHAFLEVRLVKLSLETRREGFAEKVWSQPGLNEPKLVWQLTWIAVRLNSFQQSSHLAVSHPWKSVSLSSLVSRTCER